METTTATPRHVMPDNLKAALASLTQQPQRQDGTEDQLRDLHTFANKLGLYDAADFIRTSIDHRRLRITSR